MKGKGGNIWHEDRSMYKWAIFVHDVWHWDWAIAYMEQYRLEKEKDFIEWPNFLLLHGLLLFEGGNENQNKRFGQSFLLCPEFVTIN